MFVLSVRKWLVILICAAASRCLISNDLYSQVSTEQSGATQTLSHGQNPSQTQTQDLRLAAHSEMRSKLFHLQSGSGFEVTGNSEGSRFSVDFYVYDADKVLMGREDPAAAGLSFEWHAAQEGDYYVLGRNLSDESGTIHVAVIAGGRAVARVALRRAGPEA